MTTVQRSDINHVLMQMKQIKQNIQPLDQNNQNFKQTLASINPAEHQLEVQKSFSNFPEIEPDQTTPDFETMFNNAINTVNGHQLRAGELQKRFEMGDPRVDLPEVMIAAQKSSVSFQAMTQVRNKLISAYEDIMNMPI